MPDAGDNLIVEIYISPEFPKVVVLLVFNYQLAIVRSMLK